MRIDKKKASTLFAMTLLITSLLLLSMNGLMSATEPVKGGSPGTGVLGGSPGPIVLLDPTEIEIPFCETGDIAICVENFTGLGAFEFKIWWLKDVVNFTGYEWKPYPPEWPTPLTVGPAFGENATHKFVQFAILGAVMPPIPTFSYSGKWAFIDTYWHCLEPGVNSPLIFDRDITKLYDEGGGEITIEKIIDGLIINPPKIFHWKIELAQKKCNAYIVGYLTNETGDPIPGTEFELNCTCEEEEPQPPSQRVFWKVATDVIPTDIHFVKYIDWNKDGIWDLVEPVDGFLKEPPECHCWYQHEQESVLELKPELPVDLTDPVCTYWHEIFPVYCNWYHLSSWEDTGWPYGELSYCDQVDLTPVMGPGEPPIGPKDWWHVVDAMPDHLLLNKMVVVEVHEQPYDEERPFFEWQLTIKQHNCEAEWFGFLTKDGEYLPGTDFYINCNSTMNCTVVRTPWCTVPNDIDSEVWISGMPVGIIFKERITQFPWTNTTILDPGMNFTLELTEVQMHHYTIMGGWVNTAGQLGVYPPWDTEGPWMDPPDGVPFGSRTPYLSPFQGGQNITFTQRDPITGIVKLGVPVESYVGLDHSWFSFDVGTWFRAVTVLEEQGCGWIFTQEGKEPIFGCVDLLTYNNYSGVYTYGPDGVDHTADDELLAGVVPGDGSAGAGPPIGTCLQQLRGPDGIPGTGDDPIGRGDADGLPNPPGSSILYLSTTLVVTFWNDTLGDWQPLFTQPWPLLLTTGSSQDTVMEPSSGIDWQGSWREGQPWEYFAGLDHPDQQVHWKDPKCNAYVHYVTVWSVLNTSSPKGKVDIMFEVEEKKVRDDLLIADINCDEVCDFKDLFILARAFGAEDERFPDKPVADAHFDARADLDGDGDVDFLDLYRLCSDYDFIPGYHDLPVCEGTISVDPPYTVANVGETFEVNITVSGVTDLYLALFCIRWNPAVLNLTKDTLGDFLPGVTSHVKARLNRAAGSLEAWTGTIFGPVPGADGSGTFATLEFKVIGPGSSRLDLHNCSWMKSTGLQRSFCSVQDGKFYPPPTLPVTADLELYPRKVYDLEIPICTQWHELHPNKTNFYHLTDWVPGMVLGPEDIVVMNGIQFIVDEVTIDIVVYDELENIHRWMIYECGYWTFKKDVWKSPECSKWNEIKNEFGPVLPPRCWHLAAWSDDGDGKLSYGDVIVMMPMYPYPASASICSVVHIGVTLKLTEEPAPVPPVQYYLSFLGELEEFQDMELIHMPLGTPWQQILPHEGQGLVWELMDWLDAPFLSPSDQILLTIKDPETHEPILIPEAQAWYHVDKLTVAMNLTSMYEPGVEHIVKYEGSLLQFKKYHWTDPVSTQWLEVNPDDRQWHIIDWTDTDGGGWLDPCDVITMIDKETGWIEDFHVESLSTDMWVTQKICGVDITNVTLSNCATPVGSGYTTWTIQVDVTVHNNGTIPINCTVNAYYYNATHTYQIGPAQPITNLYPCHSKTLTFNWNLAGLTWCTTFTVKANVTCTCGASDEFVNGQVKIHVLGDYDNTDEVNILDVGTVCAIYALPLTPEQKAAAYPLADLDDSCAVNILDVGTVCSCYAASLKCP